MKNIITIGRQFGSGGREIGKKLAEDLHIPYYDSEMLERAATDSGIDKDLFEQSDEKPNNNLLYSLGINSYSFGVGASIYNDLPMNHKIFLAQFETIKNIAKEGPCVLIGRCADYALEEFENTVNIFIYADTEDRIKRVMRRHDISEEKALALMKKTDKKRASYYNYYSDKKWGAAESYDLCINSSCLGIEGTAKFIERFVELSAHEIKSI